MNEAEAKMLAKGTAALMQGDETFLAFISGITFTGMSIGLTLAISDLQAQPAGSMEGVIARLTEHRDSWRQAAEKGGD